MWVKQCHKPPMTVFFNTTYKYGDDWGMVQMALFYPHYRRDFNPKKLGFNQQR
jgi:hypothetical protein